MTNHMWTTTEVATLRRMWSEGKSMKMIALAIGVGAMSVQNQRRYLGLKPRYGLGNKRG